MLGSDNGLFFSSVTDKPSSKINKIISPLLKYTEIKNVPVYLLDRILGVRNKSDYELDNVVYIAIPKHPILVIFDDNCDDNDIDEYIDDLKSDIGEISSKYGYSYIIGRPRKWKKEWFKTAKFSKLDLSGYLENDIIRDINDERKIELIISLITGSINDIDKIGKEVPNTVLDKVKKQIMLLDGEQSRFIYCNDNSKRIRIQGMAGTGKTELLMRKIKELYVSDDKPKIAFTCHNKVLAVEMKFRIESFFNFMKVEEQIDWENRLKVFHAWGSMNEFNMGIYSYICKTYGVPYMNFSESGRSFNNACNRLISDLKKLGEVEPIFDYIFIDESQDFEQSFYDLCEMICSRTVYIAGDIFQSIFDEPNASNLEADYMLDKCYRTDPRTLMFAHSIGMGLFESPPLNWLEDDEWNACGYKIDRSDGFKLTREPLRRFDDIKYIDSIVIRSVSKKNMLNDIVNIIKELKEKNETLNAEDIAVIVISNNYNSMIQFSYSLSHNILENLSWNSTIGVETKHKENNAIYISNVNNVKGLEFPFIISVLLTDIGDSITQRNSLYMSLTRSFITSYLILDCDKISDNFIQTYEKAAKDIAISGILKLQEPTKDQIENMKNRINLQKSKVLPIRQRIEDLLADRKYKNVPAEARNLIFQGIEYEWTDQSDDKIIENAIRILSTFIEK